MVICFEFRMGQYRDDDHRKDAPLFITTSTEVGALILLIARERMRIVLSLPSKNKAPTFVYYILISVLGCIKSKQKPLPEFINIDRTFTLTHSAQHFDSFPSPQVGVA